MKKNKELLNNNEFNNNEFNSFWKRIIYNDTLIAMCQGIMNNIKYNQVNIVLAPYI